MSKGNIGRRFWLTIVLLVGLLPTVGIAAEQSVTVTPKSSNILRLQEAVSNALEYYPAIKAAQEQVGAQGAVLGQALSAYYPIITFNNAYRTANVTGTTSAPVPSFDFYNSVAVFNMTLFNFGKREGTVQSARETVDATRYAYITTANNTVLAVKQAYFGVLQAQALQRVNEETVKSRDLLYRQSQAFYDVGTRPKSDVTQAQANLYTAQANLIVAQNAVRVAWVTLRNAMGLPDYPEKPLAEQLETSPVVITLDEAMKAAFALRPELLQFAAQLRAQDQTLAAARRGHLPDILFAAFYGRRGTTTTGPKGASAFPLQTTWQVEVDFNIPIFDGFNTTNKVEQALRNYNTTKAQADLQKQQVALEVEQSYVVLTASLEVVKATQAAENAAKENLTLQDGRYQVGVGSIIEVTDAQATYTSAQTSHVNALTAYKVAEAQLAKAMGGQ